MKAIPFIALCLMMIMIAQAIHDKSIESPFRSDKTDSIQTDKVDTSFEAWWADVRNSARHRSCLTDTNQVETKTVHGIKYIKTK